MCELGFEGCGSLKYVEHGVSVRFQAVIACGAPVGKASLLLPETIRLLEEHFSCKRELSNPWTMRLEPRYKSVRAQAPSNTFEDRSAGEMQVAPRLGERKPSSPHMVATADAPQRNMNPNELDVVGNLQRVYPTSNKRVQLRVLQ